MKVVCGAVLQFRTTRYGFMVKNEKGYSKFIKRITLLITALITALITLLILFHKKYSNSFFVLKNFCHFTYSPTGIRGPFSK
jgi:hypothetical protein